MPGATPRLAFFRTAARYLSEPHPFARNPVTQASHSVPWSVYAKHSGRTAGFYFPFAVAVLGWPIAMAELFKRTGV